MEKAKIKKLKKQKNEFNKDEISVTKKITTKKTFFSFRGKKVGKIDLARSKIVNSLSKMCLMNWHKYFTLCESV